VRHLIAIFSLAVLVGLSQSALGAVFPLVSSDPALDISLPPLILTVSYKLTGGAPDTAGLNGATITFTATFANGTSYFDDGATPAAISSSHSLTISGASVGATNGVYTDPEGFMYLYFTGFGGTFVDEPGGFGHTVTLPSGDMEFTLGLEVAPVEPVIGAPVSASNFAMTSDPCCNSFFHTDGSGYTLDTSGGGTLVVTPMGGPTDGSHLLTVTGSGTGDGSIIDMSGGISCTSTAGVTSGDCTELYIDASIVVLLATPAVGSSFDTFSGAGCTATNPCAFTISSNETVDAAFSAARNASPYLSSLAGPTPDTSSNSAIVLGLRSIMFHNT